MKNSKLLFLLLFVLVLGSSTISGQPDPNGCDNKALSPEGKPNCGIHLYRTNAEIFGENYLFEFENTIIGAEIPGNANET